jgi:COMPASS component SPP1
MMNNPYEADPAKIPPTDRYVEDPLYGRYLPRPTDFRPDVRHVNSTTPESLEY